MKKYLLLTLAIFTVLRASSQTDSSKTSNSYTVKGGKFVGGMINNIVWRHSSSSNGSLNSVGMQITPDFGYFIKDNFAVGVNISIGMYDGTIKWSGGASTEKGTSISYGIGGFARCYKKITDKFLLFAQGGVSYTYQTTRQEWTTTDTSNTDPAVQKKRSNILSCAVSPGLVYFIFPRLGLETMFGNIRYTYKTSENITLDRKTKFSDFGVGFNISTFFLGLNYYF